MEYQQLTLGQKQALVRQRLEHLEAEHFNARLGVATAESLPESDEVQAQLEQLRDSLRMIEAGHKAMSAELARLNGD